MENEVVFLVLLVYFVFGGFMELLAFCLIIVGCMIGLHLLTRWYLEKEMPEEFNGSIPLPLWTYVIMFVIAFFPAYLIVIYPAG